MGTSISVNPFGKIKLFYKEKESKLCFAGKWTESYHSQHRFTEDELGREFTLSKWRFQSLPCVTAIMKRRTQNAKQTRIARTRRSDNRSSSNTTTPARNRRQQQQQHDYNGDDNKNEQRQRRRPQPQTKENGEENGEENERGGREREGTSRQR